MMYAYNSYCYDGNPEASKDWVMQQVYIKEQIHKKVVEIADLVNEESLFDSAVNPVNRLSLSELYHMQ